MRTTYNGGVEATLTSLPFGDAQTTESGGDSYYFAALDYDSTSNTDHALYRQYSNTQGRWLSPDHYTGSYSLGNPQSYNRYAYVLDNPMFYTDPDGDDSDPSICYLLASLGCGSGGGGGAFYGGLEMSASNFGWDYYATINSSGISTTYSLLALSLIVPDQLGSGITVDEYGNLNCGGTPCGSITISSSSAAYDPQGSSPGGGSGASGGSSNGVQPPYNRIGPFDPRWKPNGGYPETFDTHKDQCNQIKTDTVLMGAAGYGADFLNPAVGKVLKGVAVLLGVFGISTGCYR